MKGGGMRTIRARFSLTLWVLIITAALGLGVGPAFADLGQGRPSEVEALKGELARMQIALDGVIKEQEQIRQLLSQRPSPPPRPQEVVAHVSISRSPMLGNLDAPLTLIEFSDYQCPYCRRFFEAVLPLLKAEYIETGKLRYIFRDFPLDRIHPQARKIAEAAHCAGEQGQYWPMHDLLFRNQQMLQVEQLQAYAGRLSLDAAAFDACLEQGTYAAAVQKDVEEGMAAGVQGTPAFLLGQTAADGTIQGVAISGARPITAFRDLIERLLGGR
jgi:protein-disulfide isomerase